MSKGLGVSGGDRLVPFPEAAKLLGISKRTLERRIQAGLMPAPAHNGRKRVYLGSVLDDAMQRIVRGGSWAL